MGIKYTKGTFQEVTKKINSGKESDVLKLYKSLEEKLKEASKSVLPICVIVTLLSMSISPLDTDVFALFLIGTILLILGMALFTLGAEMSMTVLGEEIGKKVAASKHLTVTVLVCFALGTVITIAEPDLSVLAKQVPSIPNMVMILTVAVGVGVFLVIGQLRNIYHWKLNRMLMVFYAIIFIMVIFVNQNFVPVAFDSAGVTTGPITVPFIMAFGIGLARLRNDENNSSDSFGLVSLCSIGPVIAVLLLSLFYETSATSEAAGILQAGNMQEVALSFLHALPQYGEEVLIALLPIGVIFILFQILTRKFSSHALKKIIFGLIYTYVGLVLFLCAANVGFMSAGTLIGASLASSNQALLVVIGAVIGYFIVKAEPAVIVLTHQVEDISNGAIKAKTIEHALSISIACSVALAMIRVTTGISILWFLVPGYIIALLLSLKVPGIYTAIAFDSGGVASGPMTTTFLLPFAMGACSAIGGNVMQDAFGIVAMVAMTPLITIQIIGLVDVLHTKHMTKKALAEISAMNNEVIYFAEE